MKKREKKWRKETNRTRYLCKYIKWPNVCVAGFQKERRVENGNYF